MWTELVIESLRRPRQAARRILDANLPEAVLLTGAVAVTCVGIVLGFLALRMTPGGVDMVSAAVLENPLLGALAQLGAMAVIIGLTVWIGQLFGGTGTMRGATALIVWLNAVLVVIQVAQIAALAVLPPLAGVLAVVAMVWALWAFASFIAELHGFRSPLVVLGAVLLTSIMLFFATAMLLAMLGFTSQGTA